MNLCTPACLASFASLTDAWWLISKVRPGIQVAQWVVRQAGKMQNGFEAFDILQSYITNVFADFRDLCDTVAEGAALEKIGVESNDFMPRLQQHWY